MKTSTIAKLLFSALMLLSLGFLVQTEEQHISFTQANGSLILKTADKSCLLADDAIAYEPYLSPDAKKVAVETELMSDLQIVRLYVKAEDGCFREVKPTLSTLLWKALSEKEHFSMDDIMHPSMQFVKWEDNTTLNISLYGELPDKTIQTTIAHTLP